MDAKKTAEEAYTMFSAIEKFIELLCEEQTGK